MREGARANRLLSIARVDIPSRYIFRLHEIRSLFPDSPVTRTNYAYGCHGALKDTVLRCEQEEEADRGRDAKTTSFERQRVTAGESTESWTRNSERERAQAVRRARQSKTGLIRMDRAGWEESPSCKRESREFKSFWKISKLSHELY